MNGLSDNLGKMSLKKGESFEKSEEINIMLMGETGVGKSTFINAIANYFRFEDFSAAVEEEPTLLIPTLFSVIDHDGNEHSFSFGKDKNETQETGKAGTQGVKTYIFPIGDTNKNLRLIDTPGMGDPRGIEQDDNNCENILSFLSGVEKLHAICFLMKPTNTRTTALFTYCVKQILARLDKTASENIVFVFTNTRGTNYTPGDTMGVLKKMVNDIEASPPYVTIPLKDNIFSMDNEGFRICLASHKGVKFQEHVLQCCIESWEVSSKESWRLITYITGDDKMQGLEPHDVKNTISINEVRNLVDQLALPLSEISQLIQDNIRALDKQKDNLSMENQSLEELKNKLFVPIVSLRVKELSQPVTVCTDKKCAEVIQVGDKTKWHYRQRCHNPCYLTGVPKEVIGDSRLINCHAMSGGRTCNECSCDYTVHMHIYYETETVDEKVEDNNVKKNIDTKEKALEEAQLLINQMDQRKKELENEHQIIVESTAKFAHFLQRNAITPFNDGYKEYIEHLIIRERSLGDSANLKIIDELKKSLKKHIELKAAFDKNVKSSSSIQNCLITPETIQKDIHRLYNLKHNGKKIKEIMEKQKTARSKEFNFAFECVTANSVNMNRFKKFRPKSKFKKQLEKQENTSSSSEQTVVQSEVNTSTEMKRCESPPASRKNRQCSHDCCSHSMEHPFSYPPYFWPPPHPYYQYYAPPPSPYFRMPPDPSRLYGPYYGAGAPNQFPNFMPPTMQNQGQNYSVRGALPSQGQLPFHFQNNYPIRPPQQNSIYFPNEQSYHQQPQLLYCERSYIGGVPGLRQEPVDEETGRLFVDARDNTKNAQGSSKPNL